MPSILPGAEAVVKGGPYTDLLDQKVLRRLWNMDRGIVGRVVGLVLAGCVVCGCEESSHGCCDPRTCNNDCISVGHRGGDCSAGACYCRGGGDADADTDGDIGAIEPGSGC